ATEFAHGEGMNACSVARIGKTAWIGCALSEDASDNLYDPFGMLQLSLGGPLQTGRPVLIRNGAAEVRASPSGGVLLLGACDADEDGDACVHQPDGKWKTIKTGVDLSDRGAGALSDGRVAFLRNLVEGDDLPDEKPAPQSARTIAKGRRPTVVA